MTVPDFWTSLSVEELAALQGVEPVTDLDSLMAPWPADDPFYGMLEWIVKERAARASSDQAEDQQMSQKPSVTEDVTRAIYEACRLEAQWSGRSIVPEPWDERDEAFRERMIRVVERYLHSEGLPTPKEAHDSWCEAYREMGWTYGPVRDPQKKTHPDLRPYEELPQDEREKDAIFLMCVYLARMLGHAKMLK